MKKIIAIALLFIAYLSVAQNSVVKHKTKVQLKQVEEASDNDKILSINEKGTVGWISKGEFGQGLEAIDQGNGIGWRLIGRNPSNYGSVGLGAVDISENNISFPSDGATGDYSFSGGLRSEALGSSSFAFGESVSARGNNSFILGFEGFAQGIGSYVLGYQARATGDYATALGVNGEAVRRATALGYNSRALGEESISIGSSVSSSSFAEISVGRYPETYMPNSINSWNSEDRIFNVGNGSDSTNPSNALTILKNGKITAPSLDISEIVDPKSLITKEYLDNAVPVIKEDSGTIQFLTPTAGTLTVVTNKATYYRVGNLVTVEIDITLNGIPNTNQPTYALFGSSGSFDALPYAVTPNHPTPINSKKTQGTVTHDGGEVKLDFYVANKHLFLDLKDALGNYSTGTNTTFNNVRYYVCGSYVTSDSFITPKF